MGVVSDTYGSLLCSILMTFIQKEVESQEHTVNTTKSAKAAQVRNVKKKHNRTLLPHLRFILRQVFVCFGTRHVAKDCRTRGISCEKCNRHHHKALCTYGEESATVNELTDAVISMSPSESK